MEISAGGAKSPFDWFEPMSGLLVTIALTSTTIGLTPRDEPITDHADVIEVNHFYDERGKLVFDQIIFWRWCDVRCEHHVMAWRFLKKKEQIPRRDLYRRGFVTVWHDSGTLRRVRSPSLLETWTQFDPEVHDRQFLPQDRRRGLGKHLVKPLRCRKAAQP